MTGKLIFKMEIFKYMKDKKYLMTTAVLAVLNILMTIFSIYFIDNMNHLSDTGEAMFGLFILSVSLTFMINMVFMFLYPFHLMSMDYKNDVMSMLVASGVNRSRLFFSKIGATLLWTMCLTIVLIFIPFLIVMIKLNQVTNISDILANVMDILRMSQFSMFGTLGSLVLGYINTLVVISTATIILKGRNLTILLYMGLNMVQSFVLYFFNFIPASLNFSMTGMTIFSNLMTAISTVIFILIALKVMNKQNL